MVVFGVRVELPDFVVVQRLKHPDMGMHHRAAIFGGHQHGLCGGCAGNP
jgi:hypothetical protein